jgi:hypothetical protein
VIVRVVLGVVLTAALFAAAAPAVSTARADAADSSVQRQLTALGERLQRMVATNDPTVGPGARHVTELTLPARTVTSAAVDRLRLGTSAGVGVASWRVGDTGGDSARLVGVPIRGADGGNLTLRESGAHRLAFGLRRQSGRTVLTVRRLGGSTDA